MSFSRAVLPPSWRPTDIETGIRYTARRLMDIMFRRDDRKDTEVLIQRSHRGRSFVDVMAHHGQRK